MTHGQGRRAADSGGTVLPSRFKSLLTVVRWTLNIVAIVCIGLFLIEHRAAIRQAAAAFETRTIGAALMTILIGLLPGAWAWQRLCSHRLPGVTALNGVLVHLRSGVGKYTPGGVLTFVIQQRLLGGHGATPTMLIQIFAGAALAACLSAGLLSLPAAGALVEPGGDERWTVLCSVLAVLALAGAYRARSLLARIWSRIGLPPPVPFLVATLLFAGAAGLTGLHLAVLGAHTGGGTLFLVSAYALSTIAGLVFAVLPGAVGARDGALLAILATRLTPADAAMVALLSRALILAGDVIGAALAALVSHLTRPTQQLERAMS
ncbi:hypothetical protein AB0G04_08680 [Actinoplanes sp. NPDC023801]|uniref:hypothetical protein n=1 Tax=Actinoplanes sp. NPDC023801 TaxID=3154595 RepID=UPI0034094B48